MRVDAVGKVTKPQLRPIGARSTDSSSARKGKREVFFTRPERKLIETPIYDYARLGAGATVKGPAVIELPFTTTLVLPGFQVTVDEYLNLVMEIH
jgi:N-methylhydantoinase A